MVFAADKSALMGTKLISTDWIMVNEGAVLTIILQMQAQINSLNQS